MRKTKKTTATRSEYGITNGVCSTLLSSSLPFPTLPGLVVYALQSRATTLSTRANNRDVRRKFYWDTT